ncbi:ECF transporter S component [Clostridium sp. Cult2]|uniref:ECF transporter S component n=1 Tax=Clostridium sp. Cult2 TaxID=2079003 RepID=UPI001F00127E|nr:ECF transporter S component [Clostridium sp. Cult2]MCF6464574.1 pantothenate ECF transporter [Clostridium sp. Cult2]
MDKSEKRLSIRRMAIVGVLGGISIVLGMTPLGFIPVGPTRATIMHIPVIIGAIMEGPLVGGLIGLIFGLFSIFQAATNPTPVSFVFLNPIVSVLPRVLIGLVTYYVYRFFKDLGTRKSIWILNIIWGIMLIYLTYGLYTNIKDFTNPWTPLANILLIVLTIGIGIYTNKNMKDKAVDIIISTTLGTLTNTVGVLSAIYFIFGEQFVEKLGQSAEMARKVIFGIGVANGIPEIIIAIIVVTNVVAALSRKK